jgi:PAS domain S-box-containing protein
VKQHSEEALLRAVVDTAVDGVILISRSGRVLKFNPACERLFGYDADEVVGQNVKMLMPTPYRAEHDTYLTNYHTTGEKKIIGIGREVVGRRKDGSTFPMDLSVGETKQDGDPIFVGIIHDLTDRKRSEQEVRESAARVKAVVDTAVDGVILIDARGHIVMFNPACERLFGYAAEAVIGRNVKMLMPDPYQAEHDTYLSNYHGTGHRKIIGIGREVIGRRQDGTTFPMDLSVGEAQQDGESVFVGIIHDLTERKRGEEQMSRAQKMETVGQLSGGIAHDFNNLLTVILGNAEFLTDQLSARADLQALAKAIMQAADRGAELTQRLLAFGRRQRLLPVAIDCNQMLDSMHMLLRRTLREDIEIRTVFEEHLNCAFADIAQLESAILNLALNAQDAMPRGGCLNLSTTNIVLDNQYRSSHPEVPPGQYVLIAVTDDGEGMPPDVQRRVFEPFFTTKGVGKGSGLGLSQVYGFVKQSNGHVAIYSEPGLGTTVRLYLPAVAATAETSLTAARKEVEILARNRTMVLVTEDDPFVRSFAVASLESLGYGVIAAIDANEALQKISSGVEIDILFSDIVMPGSINGVELAERARILRPNLKVLLTSGYALETLAARGHLPVDVAVLNKPYRRADLSRRLNEVLTKPD